MTALVATRSVSLRKIKTRPNSSCAPWTALVCSTMPQHGSQMDSGNVKVFVIPSMCRLCRQHISDAVLCSFAALTYAAIQSYILSFCFGATLQVWSGRGGGYFYRTHSRTRPCGRGRSVDDQVDLAQRSCRGTHRGRIRTRRQQRHTAALVHTQEATCLAARMTATSFCTSSSI